MGLMKAEREKRYQGLPLSEGIVVARAMMLSSETSKSIPYYNVPEELVDDEKKRLQNAVATASKQLDAIIEEVSERIGVAQANIFVAQKMMLEDIVLLQQSYEIIESKRLNAEMAFGKALEFYESLLANVNDAYIKERFSDISEIRQRLFSVMRKDEPEAHQREQISPNSEEDLLVVVAEELYPSETVTLNTERTVGFITERGGPASHTAILARALGIPAVSGIKNIHHLLQPGDEVLVNGTTGEVIHWPTESTISLFCSKGMFNISVSEVEEPVDGLEVMANISIAQETDRVQSMKGEGVGLYRTEFEFLTAGRVLTEEEQYERYVSVVQALNGKPVYIRLVDFGSDKTAQFLNIPKEENPCLGFRGSRLLLKRTDFLRAQSRAIARASAYGIINVIYPMISNYDQFVVLKALFSQNLEDISGHNIKHGVMFEVPAACLAAHEIMREADFGSIGSNDLIQYLFAVDRNNDLVAEDYNPDQSVFWQLLQNMADAAQKFGKPLSLCGELGSQQAYLQKILACGITRVSVSPRLIGQTRKAARGFLVLH